MTEYIFLPAVISGCMTLMYVIWQRDPQSFRQFFHDTFQNMLRMFIWAFNWWLKRPVRKRYKHVKRTSVAFSPELIAYYKQKVQGRQELMALWDERLRDICELVGTPLPPLAYGQPIVESGYPGYQSHHKRGFVPHPSHCEGDFEMNEVHDGSGILVTTYTHCMLCGWQATVVRDPAGGAVHAVSRQNMVEIQRQLRSYGYDGPIDGEIGDATKAAMLRMQRERILQEKRRNAHGAWGEPYR